MSSPAMNGDYPGQMSPKVPGLIYFVKTIFHLATKRPLLYRLLTMAFLLPSLVSGWSNYRVPSVVSIGWFLACSAVMARLVVSFRESTPQPRIEAGAVARLVMTSLIVATISASVSEGMPSLVPEAFGNLDSSGIFTAIVIYLVLARLCLAPFLALRGNSMASSVKESWARMKGRSI